MSQPPNASTVSQFISRKKAIPRGTTDVVMERLFPSKRSEVPTGDERREAVYAILHSAGLFDKEDDLSGEENPESVESTHVQEELNESQEDGQEGREKEQEEREVI